MFDLLPFYVLLCYSSAYEICLDDRILGLSDFNNLIIDTFGFNSYPMY
jgi:hypothetical protein